MNKVIAPGRMTVSNGMFGVRFSVKPQKVIETIRSRYATGMQREFFNRNGRKVSVGV